MQRTLKRVPANRCILTPQVEFVAYTRTSNQYQPLGLINVRETGTFRYVLDLNWAETRSGSAVVGYRKRIAAGLDASSAYSLDTYRLSSTPVTWRHIAIVPGSPESTISEVLTGHPYPVSSAINHLIDPTSAQDAEARSRLFSRLRSERTAVNGMNVLGELRETLTMIRKPASALLEQARVKIRQDELTLKRIKRRAGPHRRAELSKAVSGSLLEINFGWVPLLSDISGICDVALRLLYSRPLRKQFSATQDLSSSSVVYQEQRILNAAANTGMSCGDTWQNTVTRVGYRYDAGVLLKEMSATSALERLRVLSGFTAENILPTVYELTPWSFLVDYFTNLGDVIEAGTTDTSDVFYCTGTRFQETTVKQSARPKSAMGPPYVVTHLSGPLYRSEVVRKTLERVVYGKPPLPMLTFTHPGDSLQKLSNMLALLDQKRPRLKF